MNTVKPKKIWFKDFCLHAVRFAIWGVISTRLTAQVTPIPEPTYRAMVAPYINLPPNETYPIVQIRVPNVQKGQMIRVFGRVEFFGNIATTSGANGYNYADAWVNCLDPYEGNAGYSDFGQNYEGPHKAPGPSYPLPGHLVIFPSTLITATTAGPYTCQLLASTDKPTMVVGEAYEGDSTTWLRVSAPITPPDAQFWTTTTCTAGHLPDSGGCPYLPPIPPPPACLLTAQCDSLLQRYVEVLTYPIRLVNAQNGMCLQPDQGSTGQGAAIVQEPCNGSMAQQWTTANASANDSTVVHLVNAASKRCLDARGKANNGTPIQQWTCNSITNENWAFGINNNLLYSGVSGSYSHCIAAPANQAGQKMELEACNAQAPAQLWNRPPAYPWSPPRDAAFVDVTDTMEISMCGHMSDSCPKAWQVSESPSVVNTYVELVQLNANGGDCHKADSPIQQTTISPTPHHYVIYHRLIAVPVYPSCGTNQFLVRQYAQWVSGSPADVDEVQAISFTSYRGKAQPVPNVVGLTQSAAASALSAAGYFMNNVSSATNVAPLGSVTMQYPGAGIIELPDSGVNLTVSAGGVLVPNVVGSLEKNAIAILAAAGLSANPLSKPGCLDVGFVNAQNPVANTTVLPHSSINITVNSGTLTNGKPCKSD